MTKPMRSFLLNRQIALEARRIAHAATKTCKLSDGDREDEHTAKCNKLKREIETLALQIKLAGMQQPMKTRVQGTCEERAEVGDERAGDNDCA
jgi:ribosomal protein L9